MPMHKQFWNRSVCKKMYSAVVTVVGCFSTGDQRMQDSVLTVLYLRRTLFAGWDLTGLLLNRRISVGTFLSFRVFQSGCWNWLVLVSDQRMQGSVLTVLHLRRTMLPVGTSQACLKRRISVGTSVQPCFSIRLKCVPVLLYWMRRASCWHSSRVSSI
jgi:hypothetical protein